MITPNPNNPFNYDEQQLKEVANTIRKDIILMLAKAKSGHPGGALGMSDIFASLYFNLLKHDPNKPDHPNRDFIFLSNGHINPVLYSSLANAGYFPKKELFTLRKLNSKLQGHPHMNLLPGIENSSGPLGQGLSMAIGAALTLKLDQKENHVYAITGDGELDEGQVWEAAQLAAKYKLDNFIQIVDYNKIQLDGPTKEIMPLRNLRDKFLAFGFAVFECDGNNIKDVLVTLRQAKKINGLPVVILAHTIPGKGVSFMENDFHWHGKAPSEEEATKALEELQWN